MCVHTTVPFNSQYLTIFLSIRCNLTILSFLSSNLPRVSLSILTAQKTQGSPRWEDKEPKAFFRGRDSNQARLDLVKNHRKNTELFDVGIVAWFFFKHNEEEYGPKEKHVSFHDFFNVRTVNLQVSAPLSLLPYASITLFTISYTHSTSTRSILMAQWQHIGFLTSWQEVQ